MSHAFIINIELNLKKRSNGLQFLSQITQFDNLCLNSYSFNPNLNLNFRKMRRWINLNKPRYQHHWELYGFWLIIKIIYNTTWSNESVCKLIQFWQTSWFIQYLKYRFPQRCWSCKYLCATTHVKSLSACHGITCTYLQGWGFTVYHWSSVPMQKGFATDIWPC